MAKGLYKFYWDCGRMGSVEGVFVEDSERVEAAIGSYVDLGEVLGKHSQVTGTLDREDITLITELPEVISALGDLSVGHNPFDYLDEDGAG